jgi:aminopeptidase N
MHNTFGRCIVLTCVAFTAWSVCYAQGPSTSSTALPTQLPRTVRPTHYDVAIEPDAAALAFKGTVAISIDVLKPTASITLNALDLRFASARLSEGTGDAPLATPKIEVNEAAQTATFRLDKPIPRGTYRLALDYTGKIGTQAAGLFAIDYDSPAGRKRALYTQFEAADARRVIPSWDEPAHKATFALEVTVPTGQMAVSNMPAADQKDLGEGRSLVRFQTSPKMSTYLLFLGLGDFERATTQVAATEIGIVTKKGAAAQAAFALESSASILREYNDYFASPYPLPKLDNVAAPGSSRFFAAMENWGAILTFEYALLLDPSISTQADKQRVFSIAAHEIAHQWFGNLVTMGWWDDLWLNEGFASWMAGRTTERLHPEWNSALAAVNVRERAMDRDAIVTTHPVVQPVETVEQANQAFDAISYSKGEAVIRMLEDYVGSEAWREGVRRYLKAHAYGNTRSRDLWGEIEAAARQPVTAIAHDFTLQPGVPLIRVQEAFCAEGNTRLRLTQAEFSRDRPDKKPLRWRVPVTIKPLGAGAPVRQLVSGGKASMSIPGCAPIIINAGQSGYYRTLYQPAQLAEIARNFAAVAPVDQLGILSDSWSLGLSGQQPATDFLTLALATPTTADPQVWGKIATVFDRLNGYYDGQPQRQASFREFAIARLTPVFAQVGWTARPGEPDTVTILRNQLIETLSALGDPAVIAESRRRYASQTEENALPAALRKSVLAVVARHADVATWNQLHEAALAEKTPLIKDQLYFLLSTTEDEGLARRALKLALTDEPGATNSAAMIAGVAQLHPDLAFDFAMSNLAAVNDKVDAPSRSVYFPMLGSRSADAAMIGKINTYANTHLTSDSRRSAATAVATVTDRIRVRRERLPMIDAWLADRKASQSKAH